MPPKRKLAASQRSASQSSGDIKWCKECRRDIPDQQSLGCDICAVDFHHSCVGISKDIFDKFVDIKPAVGWVCVMCRTAAAGKIEKLQSSHSLLADEVCALQVAVEQIQTELATQPTPLFATVLKSPSTKTEFRKEVKAVMREADRRSHNIIISGLNVVMGQDDTITVEHLFEDNLTVKPYISQCKRIGKPMTTRPQKVLVTLRSSDDVTSVLSVAKQLRKATDPAVRDLVYINRDMSPEESKAAFEKREKRRSEARSDVLIPSATPVVPVMSTYSASSSLRANAAPFSSSASLTQPNQEISTSICLSIPATSSNNLGNSNTSGPQPSAATSR